MFGSCCAIASFSRFGLVGVFLCRSLALLDCCLVVVFLRSGRFFFFFQLCPSLVVAFFCCEVVLLFSKGTLVPHLCFLQKLYSCIVVWALFSESGNMDFHIYRCLIFGNFGSGKNDLGKCGCELAKEHDKGVPGRPCTKLRVLRAMARQFRFSENLDI